MTYTISHSERKNYSLLVDETLEVCHLLNKQGYYLLSLRSRSSALSYNDGELLKILGYEGDTLIESGRYWEDEVVDLYILHNPDIISFEEKDALLQEYHDTELKKILNST